MKRFKELFESPPNLLTPNPLSVTATEHGAKPQKKKVTEQHAEESRFKPTIPRMVKSKGVGPRPTIDSVKVKLKERCWAGYKPAPGKKAYSKGSCIKELTDMQYQSAGTGARTLTDKPNKEPMKTYKELKKENLDESRPSQRHPLEGHEYHKKTDAELVGIAKDAHKAAEAMKGHNTQAENKYRDQANDSATVRYFRQKSGMPDWYKKKYGHMKEETDTTEKVEMVQSQLHFMKYACDEILEYIEMGGEVEEWYQVKVAKSFSEFESLHAFIEGEKRRKGMVKEDVEYLEEKNAPTNPSLWSRAKALARSKFDVYPSAYANGWAAKWYKSKGGGWKSVSEETEVNENVHDAIKKIREEDAQGASKKKETKFHMALDKLVHSTFGKSPKEMKKEEVSNDDKSSIALKALVAKKNLKQSEGKYKSPAFLKKMQDRVKAGEKLKEDVEQIDEISKDLAGKYFDKSTESQNKLPGASDFGISDKDARKVHNRIVGSNRALDRMFRRHKLKGYSEEVEQIDEVSDETLASYKEKAKKSADELESQKKFGKALTRRTGILRAVGKQVGRAGEKIGSLAKEEKEPPFEPSKPKQKVIPGKLGAGYSTARHLARQALKKQVEKMKPMKESLDESRKTEIVKDIIKKKKNESNSEKFNPDPELSSDITKA